MKIKNLFKEKINIGNKDLIIHTSTGEIKNATTELLIEHRIKVFVNENEIMTLVCTGSHLLELVVGRLISERLIKGIDEIDNIYICEFGLRAKVYLVNNKGLDKDLSFSSEVSSCCSDNKTYLKNDLNLGRITKMIDVSDTDVFNLTNAFKTDSKIHKMTSGTHCAYLYYDNQIIISYEDIGRHNAIDKIIGHIYINDFIPEKCIVFTTGRVPVDMAKKAISARLGSLVSKSVPTIDAVDLAKKYNLNLICKAWNDSFEIYNSSV